MTNLSDNDLRVFHHIDRELYGRLVIDIGFEKPESKEIMAFWLWLETVGHPNVIDRITAVSNNAVRMIAEEAQACLAYFRSGMDPNVLRDSLRKNIRRQLLLPVNEEAIFDLNASLPARFHDTSSDHGVRGSMNPNACAFNLNTGGIINPSARTLSYPNTRSSPNPRTNTFVVKDMATPFLMNYKVRVPNASGIGLNPSLGSSSEMVATEGPTVNIVNQAIGQAVEGRTLFLTFSRGHPVRDQEVIDFFNKEYGNVVGSLFMKNKSGRTKPLFARLVLKSREMVDRVLGGQQMIRHKIRGRDLWARSFTMEKPTRPMDSKKSQK
ncbi:uncharacterized protein LOC18446805 [Amborella trichopoda]|nr:uncharacterized protein LOC18446805 [Amborella trichopoda]|eukprot:XP_006856969.2 uncharacterized protein LOC18446805 [Amborella trichopoda]